MRKNSHRFYLGWLILGALQLAAFSGSGQVTYASDELLSAEPSIGDRPQSAQIAAVRISRGFFEHPLSGSLRIRESTVAGSVRWNRPPLASYQDQQGCVKFARVNGIGEVALCFKLMGDVDSVGLNDREMATQGIHTYARRVLGAPCPGAHWQVRLTEAARHPSFGPTSQARKFTVSYRLEPSDPACRMEPIQLELAVERN